MKRPRRPLGPLPPGTLKTVNRVTIYVANPDVWDRARRSADSRDMSLSAFVEQALRAAPEPLLRWSPISTYRPPADTEACDTEVPS